MRTVQKKRLLAAILIMTLILSTCVRALAAPVNEDRKIAEGYAGCCSVEIESQNESGRSSSMDTFPGYAGMKMQRESEHFIFICSDADTIWLDELESNLENSYERITAALQKEPSTKPKVSLFPDTYAYNAMLQMLYSWWPVNEDRSGDGTAISEHSVQYMPAHLRDDIINDIYLAGPLSIGTTAVHEFTHIVANLSASIPTYLSEGIANYLSKGSERLYPDIYEDLTSPHG